MEFGHLIKQNAQQQIGRARPSEVAHVARYNPDDNRVKVIYPGTFDLDGLPVVSGWIPIKAHSVGPGTGWQHHLKGGATILDPTKGEMCDVIIEDPDTGLAHVSNFRYSSTERPPATTFAEDDKSKPGEEYFVHDSGSVFRFYKDGTIVVKAAKTLALSAVEDILLTAGRSIFQSANQDIISAAKNITSVAQENIQFSAKKNFTVQAQKNVSLAASEDFNAVAGIELNLTGQEKLTAASKTISLEASEVGNFLATKDLNLIGRQSATLSSQKILIDSDIETRISGGRHTYLTADAVNVYSTPDTTPSKSTTLTTRTRPSTLEAISDIKINGVSINTLRGAVARIFNQNDVLNGTKEEIPIMNGPANAEIILGGTTVFNNGGGFTEAKPGEVLIDAQTRARIESKKKVEIIARTDLKIDSIDSTVNSSRVMKLTAPSLNIYAVSQPGAVLTLIGSRINITSDVNFTDAAPKQIKITTPTSGNFIMDLGGALLLDAETNIAISGDADISVDVSGFLKTTSGLATLIGQAQPAAIVINCNDTVSILGANGEGHVLIGGQTGARRKLLDERFLAAYNGHTHGGIFPGDEQTDATGAQGSTSSHCTSVTQAA